jgi:UDP-glucose:(heptosyl)LPS alpha-1,3-glucosyltransferase
LRSLVRIPRGNPFTLAVVGHRQFGEYERLARQLGVIDRVRFLGFRGDPKDAYFAADLLVHPTFYDPCSLVVLEALACGLPIVTTKFNGAAELMSPECGRVVDDPLDDRALAAAIVELTDPETRRTAARSARESATQWTFDDHYRSLMAVFVEIRDERLRKAA